MLDQPTLTLDHPAVQAAKDQWERRLAKRPAPRKHSFTFETFFERFSDTTLPLSHLQKETGLTRARLYQIYDRYFRTLFGGVSARKRFQKILSRKRAAELETAEQTLLKKHPRWRHVVKQAQLASCVVEAVPMGNHGKETGRVLATSLRINGHLCSAHIARTARRLADTKRSYVRVQLSTLVVQRKYAVVIHTRVKDQKPHTFVIPTADILAAYPALREGKDVMLNIPVERSSASHKNMSKLAYWNYENAWHLLRPEETSAP